MRTLFYDHLCLPGLCGSAWGFCVGLCCSHAASVRSAGVHLRSSARVNHMARSHLFFCCSEFCNILLFTLCSISCLNLNTLCASSKASMWPSIPLVVPQATLGTAMGLATSIQMIGIGVSNLVVGQILGTKSR